MGCRSFGWSGTARPDRTAYRYGDLTLPCGGPHSSRQARAGEPPGTALQSLSMLCAFPVKLDRKGGCSENEPRDACDNVVE
jgi:hypothetical protein